MEKVLDEFLVVDGGCVDRTDVVHWVRAVDAFIVTVWKIDFRKFLEAKNKSIFIEVGLKVHLIHEIEHHSQEYGI